MRKKARQLIISLLLVCIVALIMPTEIRAANTPSVFSNASLVYDSNGSLCIQFTIKNKRTSNAFNTRHETMGYTISRCKVGAALGEVTPENQNEQYIKTHVDAMRHESGQYITYMFNGGWYSKDNYFQEFVVENGVEYEYTKILITVDSFIHDLREVGYTEWADEVVQVISQGNVDYSIILDSVRNVYYFTQYGNPDSRVNSAKDLMNPNTYNLKDINDITKCVAPSGEGIYNRYWWRDNWEEIKTAVPWTKYTRDGMYMNFYIVLTLSETIGKPDDTVQPPDNTNITLPPYKPNAGVVATIGKPEPYVATGTTSDTESPGEDRADDLYNLKYDVSEGIPSSEVLRNRIKADGWYGEIDIGQQVDTKTYNFSYELHYTKYRRRTITYWDDYDENGLPNGHWATHTWVEPVSVTKYSGSDKISVNRSAEYYYVLNINLLDYVGTTIQYARDDAECARNPMEIDYVADTAISTTYDITINGENNPTSISSYYPLAEQMGQPVHVDWADADMSTIVVTAGSESDAFNRAVEIAEGRVLKPAARNDNITINGVTYLDGTWTDLNISNTPMYQLVPADGYSTETYEGSYTIEAERPNGNYNTYMTNVYQRFAPLDNVTRTVKKEKDDAIFEGFVSDYLQNIFEGNTAVSGITGQIPDLTGDFYSIFKKLENKVEPYRLWHDDEPVRIHTPVISPVTIVDENGNKLDKDDMETQLVKENEFVDYQLRLDEEYTFKFNPAIHRNLPGYGYSEDPSKYDKYVKEKQAKFPFDVEVNGVYYEASHYNPDTGYYYTDWITVDNNEQEFYIPSWATEQDYCEILYRVLSINYIDTDGINHILETEEAANITFDTATGDNSKYVATYKIALQLSGHIYNFQIVGLNDRSSFGKKNSVNSSYSCDSTQMTVFPLSPDKLEKRTGVLNRIGGVLQRYNIDNEATVDWPVQNTLPLRLGSSPTYKYMGNMKKGTTIYYTIDTIANLYDEAGDRLQIIPRYRYVAPDGTVKEADEIDIYYIDAAKNLKKLENDTQMRKVSLDDEGFSGTWTDEDVNFTIEMHERGYTTNAENPAPDAINTEWTNQYITVPKRECYNLSEIMLDYHFRLLEGRWDKLKRNLTATTLSDARFVEELPVSDVKIREMRASMQTWYGAYTVPQKILVCDKDFNFADYSEKNGGFNEYSDCWYSDKGYLILSFDIVTYNDNAPHLKYYGGVEDMWKQENPTVGQKIPIEVDFKTGDTKIETDVRSGDVAVITLRESVNDAIVPGYLYID